GDRIARAGRDLERIGAGARLTQVVQVDRVRGWNAVDRRVSREGDVGSGFGELRHVQTLDVPAARVIHDVAAPVGSVDITPRDEAEVDDPTGRIVDVSAAGHESRRRRGWRRRGRWARRTGVEDLLGSAEPLPVQQGEELT